jgi:hypothetical protein
MPPKQLKQKWVVKNRKNYFDLIPQDIFDIIMNYIIYFHTYSDNSIYYFQIGILHLKNKNIHHMVKTYFERFWSQYAIHYYNDDLYAKYSSNIPDWSRRICDWIRGSCYHSSNYFGTNSNINCSNIVCVFRHQLINTKGSYEWFDGIMNQLFTTGGNYHNYTFVFRAYLSNIKRYRKMFLQRIVCEDLPNKSVKYLIDNEIIKLFNMHDMCSYLPNASFFYEVHNNAINETKRNIENYIDNSANSNQSDDE